MRVNCGSRNVKNSSYSVCPRYNRAQRVIPRSEHMDIYITLIVFLEFESNADQVTIVQVWVVMWYNAGSFLKGDIAYSEYFGSLC